MANAAVSINSPEFDRPMALDLRVTEAKTNREIADFLSVLATKKPADSPVTEQVFQWALDLDRGNAAALNGLGKCALAKKDWSRAAECFAEAIVADPEDPMLRVNASMAYDRLGYLALAEKYVEGALELDPGHVMARLQLFGLHIQQQNYALAEKAIRDGLEITPESHELWFALSEIELEAGRNAEGWAHYQHRPTRLSLVAQMDEYREWHGQPLNGKRLIVLREQGIGDEIMFARYLPWLMSLGGRVILYTYPGLARLLAPLVDEVITTDKDVPDFDYWVASGSLAMLSRHFGEEPEGPYLPLRTSGASVVKESPRLKVGLRWAGNPKQSKERFRSVPYEVLRPVLEIPGIDFYSLQDGSAANDSTLPCIPHYCHDILDLAENMSRLDLVITCDTMIAHLAGAIGVRTMVMLSKPADWRWGKSEDSSWYPKTLLVRQETGGDWDSVARSVHEKLIQIADFFAELGIVDNRSGGIWNGLCVPHIGPSLITTRECRHGVMSWNRYDQYIGRSLDLYGEYSPGELDAYRRLIKEGDTVVEVGANIGALTVPLAAIVGQKGIVYAIEPQAEYVELLKKNTASVTAGRISVQHMAMGSEWKQVTLRASRTDRLSAPGQIGNEGEEYQIQQGTIDGLNLDRCDFIKVDVDGPEHEILLGAESTIDRLRPLIYVEWDKPEKYPDMAPWLISKGYRLYQHWTPLYAKDNFRGNPVNVFGNMSSLMLLCIPTERHDLRIDTLGLQLDRVKAVTK